MANVKITDLPQITYSNITSSDVIPIVDVNSDTTSKVTMSDLKDYFNTTFTGGTVTGATDFISGLSANELVVSGDSFLNGFITSLNFSGTTDRIVEVNSGGTLTATTQIIGAYIFPGSPVAILLSDTNNWDLNGEYIGTPITGTFQGQKYYDASYFYEAIDNNLFIRLIRG